jgi:hypothetical protein
MTTQKVPVSERALPQRINRKLDKDFVVKKTRGASLQAELGDYYCIDLNRNQIVAKDCDLERLGRERGVLNPWEELSV